jgi:hypothetical protein
MGLIPKRNTSKKHKAARAASKAGKKVTKAKAVQKAPKTAAAVWAGKRSGKVVKGVAIAIVGIITLKAVRSKLAKHDEPATPPSFPDTTPVPDPGQSPAGSPINGSAPQPDPAAPFSPPVSSGTTPPQGDKAADVIDEEPTGRPDDA